MDELQGRSFASSIQAWVPVLVLAALLRMMCHLLLLLLLLLLRWSGSHYDLLVPA
jgi:hypothetical protein